MGTEKQPKIFFIIITRGFIIRNILRSGVLTGLKKQGHKIVVFLCVRGGQVPDYLKQEFEDKQVTLEVSQEPSQGPWADRFQRVFSRMVAFLVYTDSSWAYGQIGNEKNLNRKRYKKLIERFIFRILSRIHFLKRVARFLDRVLFPSNCYSHFFDRYKPDGVFSTSIISLPDIYFMKEAKKRGIKTISMPKGWDNVTKSIYRFIPDRLLVHNEIMKDWAVNEQRIAAEQVTVCGFPQFDWYRRPEIIRPRAEHLGRFGIDSNKSLILFGSEGVWTPQDDVLVDIMAKAIEDGRIKKSCTILIRPHYSNIKEKRYERFRGQKNIVLDDTLHVSDAIYCNWDPGVEETELLVNSIYHSAVMVTTASTLVLDACCFDKPVVAPAFGVLYNKKGEDVSPILYHTDHFQAVTEENAIDMVFNEKEFIDRINDALFHPERLHEKRTKLLRKMCYLVDGRASERMVGQILAEVSNKTNLDYDT